MRATLQPAQDHKDQPDELEAMRPSHLHVENKSVFCCPTLPGKIVGSQVCVLFTSCALHDGFPHSAATVVNGSHVVLCLATFPNAASPFVADQHNEASVKHTTRSAHVQGYNLCYPKNLSA